MFPRRSFRPRSFNPAGGGAPVNFAFLDGANDLYIDVPSAPLPRPGAVIATDMSYGDKNHDAYRAHVTSDTSGLLTSEISLDAGIVISIPT